MSERPQEGRPDEEPAGWTGPQGTASEPGAGQARPYPYGPDAPGREDAPASEALSAAPPGSHRADDQGAQAWAPSDTAGGTGSGAGQPSWEQPSWEQPSWGAPTAGQASTEEGRPEQPYGGQPPTGQPYSGQPYSGQSYSGQSYSGQPYSGQPYSGQPYSGQSYSGQPYSGAGYSGQGTPGQHYSGQGYGQGSPAPYGQYGGQPSSPGGQGIATSTIVLLVVSAVCFFTGALTLSGIAGLVFGVLAATRAGRDPEGARRLTRTGWIVFAVITAVLVVAVVVGIVGLFSWLGSMSVYDSGYYS